MKHHLLLLFITLSLALPFQQSPADTLLVDKIGSERSTHADIPRPRRGQSMEFVRRDFGEPQSVLAAVGDPPITRWVYQGFTVYFEHQWVITSVVQR